MPPGNSRLASSRADQIRFLVESLQWTRQAIRVRVETPEGQLLHSVDIPAEGAVAHAVIPPAEPHGREEPSPARPKQREGPAHPLRVLLLDILTDTHPGRLTLKQIVDELEGRGTPWSERHTFRFLKELAQEGVLDNRENDGTRGSGYGFC
jgi:hypothetical protein